MRTKHGLPVGSYTPKQVQIMTGATYNQLAAWSDMGVVAPSIALGQGTGRWRLYSLMDVARVKIALELRRVGVSLQAMRPALAALQGLDLSTRGARRFLLVQSGSAAIVNGRDLLAALQRGSQGVVIFSLDGILEELSGDDAA